MKKKDKYIISRMRRIVEDILASSPKCHDFDHTMRMVKTARHLQETEGGDPFIVECGALLHDIGRPAEFADQGETCHARIGAEQAAELLAQAGVNDSRAKAICDCIAFHRYRSRGSSEPPTALEAKIIFDADKLDSMGAIGIGRAFYFAGRIGARVHNSREEALEGKSYGLNDSAYREYLVKLQYLLDKLLTAEGRRLGRARHHFMREFFTRLERESEGDDFGS